jgi:hypothetical protein
MYSRVVGKSRVQTEQVLFKEPRNVAGWSSCLVTNLHPASAKMDLGGSASLFYLARRPIGAGGPPAVPVLFNCKLRVGSDLVQAFHRCRTHFGWK